MSADKLAIYLNDHLAGATFGTGLARRIARRGRNGAHGAELEHLAEQIAEDRNYLLTIMGELGLPVRRYKVYGGRVAELLERLKPNGVLHDPSGLNSLMELETLRLGVEGKALLWRTLLRTGQREGALDEDRIGQLLERALEQIDTLEALRMVAVEANFSQDVYSTAPGKR
ncbi:hypothetical protein [Streptomyces sp. NPDC007083]|uniref:hypothetical protein n=1 Tax=Streptomyces sp. NPDC007083 TaxID=3156913 RepID=UPI00340561C5